MRRRLSSKQIEALHKLDQLPSGAGTSAYVLRCSLATMESLKARGLVRRMNPGAVGSIHNPRTVTVWQITGAGRAALKNNNPPEGDDQP